MEVRGISWLGTRVADHERVVTFFRDVLGLPARQLADDFTVFTVPGGASFEVFGPRCSYNRHLTHPVAGFLVDDLQSALAELEDAGAEIVLAPQVGDTGAWLHFRAPDGFIYELTEHRVETDVSDR